MYVFEKSEKFLASTSNAAAAVLFYLSRFGSVQWSRGLTGESGTKTGWDWAWCAGGLKDATRKRKTGKAGLRSVPVRSISVSAS